MSRVSKCMLIITVCFLFSCQKEFSIDNGIDPVVTSGDSTLLEKLVITDTLGAAPFNVNTYICKYDLQKRISSSKYLSAGGMDSTYFVNYTYPGSDTMPEFIATRDLLFGGGTTDTSFSKHFYTYDTQDRVVRDSTFNVSVSPFQNDTSVYVNAYQYFADGFLLTNITYDLSAGTVTIWEQRYYQVKDSRGNIIKETMENTTDNLEVVIDLTYDNNPNPLFKTYRPNYPEILFNYLQPNYLGNINPQRNNVLSVVTNVYDLLTGDLLSTASKSFSYEYKLNGYPQKARMVSSPASPFDDKNVYEYFYTN